MCVGGGGDIANLGGNPLYQFTSGDSWVAMKSFQGMLGMVNVGLFVSGILLQRKMCLAAFCVTVATCCLRKHALFPIGGLQKYKTGILKDVSMAEAGKFASLKEYAFFDQVNAPLPPPPLPNYPLCNPPPPTPTTHAF